jgi:hypothetical protein
VLASFRFLRTIYDRMTAIRFHFLAMRLVSSHASLTRSYRLPFDELDVVDHYDARHASQFGR